MSSELPAAPQLQGALTRPPSIDALRDYVIALDGWRRNVDTSLDALDHRAQQSQTPDAYSDDVSLAMALRASIDMRTDEVIKVWDSGRVGALELAHAAELVWGRLPDALGNPSAFSLAEACTLLTALYARLNATLDGDLVAGSGAGDAIESLRATLDRLREAAKALRRRQDDVAALAARLESLMSSSDPKAIASGVAAIDADASALEAALVKEIGLRASVTRDTAAAAATLARLLADEQRLRELAAVVDDKIASPPRLAIPDVGVAGDPPTVPTADIDAEPGTWTSARRSLDAYLLRLTAIDAALTEARRRYEAPMSRRGELRGLLGAYRDKANRAGLSEDSALCARYDDAHAVLYAAPCDLTAAETLTSAYAGAVRTATGEAATDDPPQLAGAKEER